MTLDNNSGLSILDFLVKNEDFSLSMGIFYPPPKSNGVLSIHQNPFKPLEYYMLVQNGVICKFKMENETGVFERSFNCDNIYDNSKMPIQLKIIDLKFMDLKPFPIDMDSNSIINKLEDQSETLAIACIKGTIIFININNPEKLYARFILHRETIVQMN
jgi:hypothetical protein